MPILEKFPATGAEHCEGVGTMTEQAISFQDEEGVTVAILHDPELTAATGEILQARLLELTTSERPARFILDLSNLKFLGSVGLGMLVVFLKRVKTHEGRLALAGLTGYCRNVIEVTGLCKVLDLHKDVPSALAAMQHTG